MIHSRSLFVLKGALICQKYRLHPPHVDCHGSPHEKMCLLADGGLLLLLQVLLLLYMLS